MGNRLVPEECHERRENGFTLLETTWAIVFLTIAAVVLTALASHAIRAHRRVLDSRVASVRMWNQAADFFAGGQNGEALVPIPGRRPLRRLVVTNQYGRRWEVLRAEK